MRRSCVLVALSAGLALSPAAAQVPDDPVRVAETARAAQSRYEKVRLRHLSTTWSRSGSRQNEIVGRIALIDDAELEEWRPGPDPAPVADARRDLLAALEEAAARLPADGWIAGQRVFYQLEADDAAAALAAARECRGEGWWCRALLGWALHAGGEFVASESAFHEALAAMPPSERDRWTDLRPLLDGDSARLFEDVPDATRSRLERRYWWLADPLWSLPGNDRLRGLELGLELERPLLDERDPEPLVLDDHVGGGEPDDEQQRDRDEVAEMLADRDAHPPSPAP